jgi:hypothetical protein
MLRAVNTLVRVSTKAPQNPQDARSGGVPWGTAGGVSRHPTPRRSGRGACGPPRLLVPPKTGRGWRRAARSLDFAPGVAYLMRPTSMHNVAFPAAGAPSALPTKIRLAVASSSASPPEGDDWLHEIKYDGHRIVAVLDGRGGLKLITRNGYDRTPLFRAPFRDLPSCGREIVLDGQIAVSDDCGVTHIGHLHDAIAGRWADRLAYFTFDLLHLDGQDLRRCPMKTAKPCCSRRSTMSAVRASSMSTTSSAAARICSNSHHSHFQERTIR